MIPNEVTLKLGKFIKNRRNQIGLSEYDFAQALDESVFFVRQAEQGMLDPEIPELINILNVLDMTFPEFCAVFEGLISFY